MWYNDARILDLPGSVLLVSELKADLVPLTLGSDNHSLWKSGRRVTMQAQVMPRFASVTP